MVFYRVYLQSDGNMRRGAKQGNPAPKHPEGFVWFSPNCPYVVYDYIDGQGKTDRTICALDKIGDPTFRVRYFQGEAETKTDVELFARMGEVQSLTPAKKKRKPTKKTKAKE